VGGISQQGGGKNTMKRGGHGAFRLRAPHHAKTSFEGVFLLLGARALVTVLVQRRVIPEDGLNFGQLEQGKP
jgi:hypothetical protein